jgi:CheY-like chemotaxis protein
MQEITSKILIIDDEKAMCDLVSEMLAAAGYATESAVTGREGLGKFAQGHFRAVITDLWMPVMDGVSTIVAIRRKDKTIPIVLMTGYSEKEQLVNSAILNGASCILTKPFSMVTLKNALDFLNITNEPGCRQGDKKSNA